MKSAAGWTRVNWISVGLGVAMPEIEWVFWKLATSAAVIGCALVFLKYACSALQYWVMPLIVASKYTMLPTKPPGAGLQNALNSRRKSAEVTGAPVCQVTPGRMWKV